MRNFKGKIAFITGGASGAGLGQAKVFAKEGMKVAIADIRREALHNAVSEIVEFAGCKVADVLPLCFDLTDRAAFAPAAESAEKTGGPPHLLIPTAGVNSFGPVEASRSTISTGLWAFALATSSTVLSSLFRVCSSLTAAGTAKPEKSSDAATRRWALL